MLIKSYSLTGIELSPTSTRLQGEMTTKDGNANIGAIEGQLNTKFLPRRF